MKGCNIVNNFKEAKSGVELEAYSSFLTNKSELANPSSHILSQIHPNQRFVISLSDSTIGIYSYGGLSYGAISSIDLNIIDDMQQNSFTCGTLLRPIAKKDENPVSPTIANYFLVGTGGLKVFLYDLSRVSICGRDYFPALTYSVRSPTVKAISNGHVVALAGKDGCKLFLSFSTMSWILKLVSSSLRHFIARCEVAIFQCYRKYRRSCWLGERYRPRRHRRRTYLVFLRILSQGYQSLRLKQPVSGSLTQHCYFFETFHL